MNITQTLDSYGTPAWIALVVLSFIVFWPLGLVVLYYMYRSGRMGCWKSRSPAQGMTGGGVNWGKAPGRWYRYGPMASSGNAAFDAYKEETLRRLEEEQKEFQEYLERLRQARDKDEFDRFMADRARRDASDVEVSGEADGEDAADKPKRKKNKG